MAEIKGESSPYIQKRGQINFMQNITGTAGKVMLSGKMGKILTATPISIVSASVDDVILKEDSLDVVTFPEYVDVLLSTGTTIQFPVESWELDPDYEDNSVIGTYFHEAIYNVPTYYLGEKPTVFLSVHVKPVLIVSGGILNSYDDYKSRTFLSNANLVISEISKSAKLDALIVAGGGGGGKSVANQSAGGGGGAGGLKVLKELAPDADTFPVVVGAGGDGGYNSGSSYFRGANGGNSSIFDEDVDGGGGGGSVGGNTYDGADGGSGGGSASGNPAGDGISGIGHDGGVGVGGTFWWMKSGGGGGGAGSAGADGVYSETGGGAGGNAVENSFRTGSNIDYAKGGRGGDYTTTAVGGGANTGNGGAAGKSNGGANGAPGGSGIVVIRYSADYILE